MVTETIGELVSPGGYVKGVKEGVRGLKKGAKVLAPKAGEMVESYMGRMGMKLNVVPEGEFIKRDEFTSYMNQPKQLQGFRASGANKGFDEQNYKNAEFLEIKFDDGTVHYDAIRGLNRTHSMSRAFGNWPAADEIKILSREQAQKIDPALVKEVDMVMGEQQKKVATPARKATIKKSQQEPK